MPSKGHLCFRIYIEYSARILFVVRPHERNVLDQRRLEYGVEKYILLCLLHDPNTNIIG
jgi:hypothetical protein